MTQTKKKNSRTSEQRENEENQQRPRTKQNEIKRKEMKRKKKKKVHTFIVAFFLVCYVAFFPLYSSLGRLYRRFQYSRHNCKKKYYSYSFMANKKKEEKTHIHRKLLSMY